ncbi:MAG TPA: phosphate acyltransferase PlsX [Terriglobales bacterium]|nr:phosphate acyltransferase PlsX [Terriglobales bacterium]
MAVDPLTIALDAMGSDRAPQPEIEGAVAAVREYGVRVLLVGLEAPLRAALAAYPAAARAGIEIVPATEVITMEDKAVRAVRTKRDSSVHVCARLVKSGRAVGLVSAGNTGAVMATSKLMLGSLAGVQRPALATVVPTAGGRAAILIDVGANVDCRPDHLEQFAVMGEIYYRVILGSGPAQADTATGPRVGLLSIGEEEIKGNELTREAFTLLRRLPINFIGNVEGRDLYNGAVEVIVCDGFVGNVALKISEGLVETVRALLKELLSDSLASRFGYWLSRHAYAEFKKRLDYSEYGGAPLLGVRGVVIICHGRSNAKAIKNAIRVAAESAAQRVNQQIETQIGLIHTDTPPAAPPAAPTVPTSTAS